MKQLWFILMLALFMANSGCATFRCNRLPKQSIKPLLVKKDYLITEQLSFDEISALQFAGLKEGKMATNLRLAITSAGGRCLSDEKIEREIKKEVSLAVAIYQKSNNLRKAELSVAVQHKTYGLAGGRLQEDLVIVHDDESGRFTSEIYGVIMSAEEYAFRCEQVVREEFYEKMRANIAFRNQWIPPDSIWVDSKTSMTQGNSGTWFLEGLLFACSGLLIPAHHNKVLDVQVSVYENETFFKHKYEDAWNNIWWLPLLPIGLIQEPNDKIVDSIKNNIAITAVNDFQQDQEKNRK